MQTLRTFRFDGAGRRQALRSCSYACYSENRFPLSSSLTEGSPQSQIDFACFKPVYQA